MIRLPEEMRRRALADGPDRRQWLADLPGLIADLRTAWSLTLGEPLPGGKNACVLRVRASDGTDAVLKIAPPGDIFASQVVTIAAAAGRGYVRMYAHDPQRRAVLLEPLGPTLAAAGAAGLPPARMLDILSATLRQAWQVPRPAGAVVPPGGDKAAGLAGLITELWHGLGRPCSARLVELALACAGRRAAAFSLPDCIVCHGDPHPANALAVTVPRDGAESGYVFVDPEGLLAEAAYDLGVVLRAWPGEVLAAGDPVALLRGYAERLAAATGVAEQAIWEWGFTERVSSGLYLIRYGHEQEGRWFLDSAERLARFLA